MFESDKEIAGRHYPLPQIPDDRRNIDNFLERNRGKKVVVVQGLGFVGAVMSLVVANAISEEYAVIGVDLPKKDTYWKIKSINDGIFPVISTDKKVEEYYNAARAKGNLFATFDPYAYKVADVVIVDINLDVAKTSSEDYSLENYDVSTDAFRKAIETIATNCRPNILVLVETTVPPGTCEKIVKPVFDEMLKKRRVANEVKIGHSYERVMPGPGYVDSIQNFYRVYSGIDEKSANATEQFLRTIIYTDKFRLTRLHSTTASEMSKVLENSFRAMNIAFMQEWTAFSEEAGVNLYEILDAIRMRPTHKNIMSPGLGVGGYCLPKDPLLASWARQRMFNGAGPLSQSVAAVSINDRMPIHTFQLIRNKLGGSLKGKRVAFLGVSYLSNVGDTRYAPAEVLYDLLLEAGAEVQFNDAYVPIWSEKNLASQSLNQLVVFSPQVVVFCTRHDYFRSDEVLEQLIDNSKDLFVFDAVGFLNKQEIDRFNKQCKLSIVGRGDI